MSSADNSDPPVGPATHLQVGKPPTKGRATAATTRKTSKTPARTNEVVEIDDNDDTPEPQANSSKPKQKRKRAAPVDLASLPPMTPGEVSFPAELPRNLADMFRQYFLANNTNLVPVDIYYMQVPWVFHMHNAKNKKDASIAAYYHGATGQQVQVRPYSLPWMLDLPGGRNSQRLLVASGPPFNEPVILARIKRGSSEFRVWRGVNDNPFEQAVVVKKKKAFPMPAPVNNYLTPIGSAAMPGATAPLPLPKLPILPALPALPTLPAPASGKRKREHTPASEYPELPDEEEEYTGDDGYSNALVPVGRSVPSSTIPQVLSPTTVGIARNIVFRFHGGNKQERVRNLFQCGTFNKLFTNAIVGGVFGHNDHIQILDCEWCVSNGSPASKLVADEQDFDDLMTDITEDRGWTLADAKCFVDVTRKTW